VPRSGVYSFSITSWKDDLFRPFVIPAKAGIQADFEPLLDSGFRRNDVMNPDFLKTYLFSDLHHKSGSKQLNAYGDEPRTLERLEDTLRKRFDSLIRAGVFFVR